MIQLTIPSSFSGQNVVSFYNNAVSCVLHQDVIPKFVNVDFTNLSFIKPEGVVTLSNLVRLFNLNGIEVTYTHPENYVNNPSCYPAVDYLDDSLFFEKIFGSKLHARSRQRDTTNGIEFLKTDSFNKAYLDKTIAWLKCDVNLRDRSFGTLDTALTEVFNNIIDHSQSVVGGTVFAQHYPRKDEIVLCISDFGIGIPTSIRKKYDILNDADAIHYATLQHITTESNPQNRGMGLDTLVNIIKNNGGNLLITSNKGSLIYIGARDQQRLSLGKNYMGTLIILVFRTDTLELEEEEDLSWQF